MTAEPRANRPPQHPPPLDHHAAALGDGRVEGRPLGLGGVEVVALLDEGALGHQVLAPGR